MPTSFPHMNLQVWRPLYKKTWTDRDDVDAWVFVVGCHPEVDKKGDVVDAPQWPYDLFENPPGRLILPVWVDDWPAAQQLNNTS